MVENSKKESIGIMQGRLTEPCGRGIQFFPFENWREEFNIAQEIGLNEIEFIFDYEYYEKNPLWSAPDEIAEMINKTGVCIHSVCFDYYMRRPFFKYEKEEKELVRKENKEILQQVLKNMSFLGIHLIEIPLVDDSSLKSETQAKEFAAFLKETVNEIDKKIRFGLETDLPPIEFKRYLDFFADERIGANYDSGNSSGLGYDPYLEVTTLSSYIFNIHIKDRVLHGTTVALGTGSADFEKFFTALGEIKYSGSFILQAARGEDGRERENIIGQMQFLKDYLNKYNLPA